MTWGGKMSTMYVAEFRGVEMFGKSLLEFRDWRRGRRLGSGSGVVS